MLLHLSSFTPFNLYSQEGLHIVNTLNIIGTRHLLTCSLLSDLGAHPSLPSEIRPLSCAWQPVPQSSIVATSMFRHLVHWDLLSKQPISIQYQAHERCITDIAWSSPSMNASSSVRSSVSLDGDVHVWDRRTDAQKSQLSFACSEALFQVEWHPVVPYWLAVRSPFKIHLFDIRRTSNGSGDDVPIASCALESSLVVKGFSWASLSSQLPLDTSVEVGAQERNQAYGEMLVHSDKLIKWWSLHESQDVDRISMLAEEHKCVRYLVRSCFASSR